MTITFKTDGSTYSGQNVTEVVEALMHDSHDRVEDIHEYMKAVRRRVRQMYGVRIRISTVIEFLHDLEMVGEGHLIKSIL